MNFNYIVILDNFSECFFTYTGALNYCKKHSVPFSSIRRFNCDVLFGTSMRKRISV